MKNFLKSLFTVILILAVAVGLGAVGIQLDRGLETKRLDGALGHGIPVYTMILPMLYLGLICWISIIWGVFKFMGTLIRKKRFDKTKHEEEQRAK